MCLLCALGPDREFAFARRAHVLQLLALVEHPDALPAEDALRLGQEIMTLVNQEPTRFRCHAVASPECGPRSPR